MLGTYDTWVQSARLRAARAHSHFPVAGYVCQCMHSRIPWGSNPNGPTCIRLACNQVITHILGALGMEVMQSYGSLNKKGRSHFWGPYMRNPVLFWVHASCLRFIFWKLPYPFFVVVDSGCGIVALASTPGQSCGKSHDFRPGLSLGLQLAQSRPCGE